jgi:hypothetical protein
MKELYFLIMLNNMNRKTFFETEFKGGSYDDDSCVAVIDGVEYEVERIVINDQQFLIKDCEVIKCTPL